MWATKKTMAIPCHSSAYLRPRRRLGCERLNEAGNLFLTVVKMGTYAKVAFSNGDIESACGKPLVPSCDRFAFARTNDNQCGTLQSFPRTDEFKAIFIQVERGRLSSPGLNMRLDNPLAVFFLKQI